MVNTKMHVKISAMTQELKSETGVRVARQSITQKRVLTERLKMRAT
jgi:hypothetical protein